MTKRPEAESKGKGLADAIIGGDRRALIQSGSLRQFCDRQA
ncbi:MAG: hypothetical protein ACKVOI_10935 [Dongiaceae bacterium]